MIVETKNSDKLPYFQRPKQNPARHTIRVEFSFNGGCSKFAKDDRGRDKYYHPRKETGFLPLNKWGTELLELFKIAFRRRIMFGLGERIAKQQFAPTFNIHLKTNLHYGASAHGYPDPTYDARTREELKDNGVTVEDIVLPMGYTYKKQDGNAAAGANAGGGSGAGN